MKGKWTPPRFVDETERPDLFDRVAVEGPRIRLTAELTDEKILADMCDFLRARRGTKQTRNAYIAWCREQGGGRAAASAMAAQGRPGFAAYPEDRAQDAPRRGERAAAL